MISDEALMAFVAWCRATMINDPAEVRRVFDFYVALPPLADDDVNRPAGGG